jgi:hypothetical protein
MIAMGRPVIDFLNDLATEIAATRNGDDGPLETAVKKAEENLKPFDEAKYVASFKRPKAKEIKPEGPETSTITYQRPKKRIDRLKKLFKVGTNYEVGEKTFDEFYNEAIGEDDDE